ncbi:mannosyltransferase [Rickenella mellea]|uniref:GDP-Man:Man(3)GlcNAc(2)-PP-Dol alpha-1,2-mannosyltransferase n=1 Tax=Rickenella mellea TaxID=50990 RepID=A0A4Y7Q7S1_9AGAM|nr:mannosyltransferase [Rickenella mellea]
MLSGTKEILLLTFILPVVILFIYALQLRLSKNKRRNAVFRRLGITNVDGKSLVGFFHPYCNAGGGGELVLWTAVAFLQRTEPNLVSVVYTGDTDATKDAIIGKVKARFNIDLSPDSLHFVFLKSRRLVEDSTWPVFTLLGQSLGSMILAWEAMHKLIPHIYIDTMGYAFTLPVVRMLGNIPRGAYVHYPTISTIMLERVKSRQAGYTNSGVISSSPIFSKGKLLYYRIFMYYYCQSLKEASFIMVNSSWTQAHVDAILKHTDTLLDSLHCLIPFKLPGSVGQTSSIETQIVYPPCETREMAQFPLKNRERVILSVAQFRPEKNHQAQLFAFYELLVQHPEYRSGPSAVKLVLVGGCRNAGDFSRVKGLRACVKDLKMEENVEFVVNAPYHEVLAWLARASIGLSTMVDEHFGVNIVEFMAAGVIPVTHASGGPLNDIVVPFEGRPTGYHATETLAFVEAMQTVLAMLKDEEIAMRSRARRWAVQRFSREEFEKGWEKSGWK